MLQCNPEVDGNYGERFMEENHNSLKFTSSILTSPGKPSQESLVTKRDQLDLGKGDESVIRATDRRF
jgi:hypothetical protein